MTWIDLNWREYLTLEKLSPIMWGAVRILIILLVVMVLVRLLRRWTPRLAGRLSRRMGQDGRVDAESEKRAETLSGIMVATMVVVAWVVGLIMVLKEAGFDIGPILAGAGVVGLAVGFGAQNLVRDVITGALMLLEDQVRVGDVAIINGTGGLVERINLRTIVLRGLDGTVHVFPNGVINSMSNMTKDFSFYVFELGVAYKEDTDRVAQVVIEEADKLRGEADYRDAILEPLEVLGVDKFADSAVVIKARIKTQPIKQWMVGREMNRRIKKRFDAEGIEIPFPHLSLYTGEATKPLPLELPKGMGGVMPVAAQQGGDGNHAASHDQG